VLKAVLRRREEHRSVRAVVRVDLADQLLKAIARPSASELDAIAHDRQLDLLAFPHVQALDRRLGQPDGEAVAPLRNFRSHDTAPEWSTT
jgi:hypothetical protein